MKKITAIFLFLATVLCLFSCSDRYKPVKSTKEEARVVMTLSLGGEEYEIKYELYRAFFLSFKSDVDGGDPSVWSGDRSGEYIDKINELIKENCATIYSALHHASTIGIDPYSKEFDEQIEEYVRIGVEGNGDTVKGHGGDYGAYLESLKKMNLNYSVSTLLIRYQLTLEAITEYYGGRVDEVLGNVGGEYEIKREDVESYYNSDECARVLYIYYPDGIKTDEELLTVKDALSLKESDLDVALYIINHSMGLESDLIKNKKVTGSIIGRYALNDLYYSEFTKAAFDLKLGEVSDIIKIGGDSAGSYIIYKLDKTGEHLTEEYETVKSSYIDNLIGKKLDITKSELLLSAELTKNYSDIEHSSIKMD